MHSETSANDSPSAACLCASLRKAARSVTLLYDARLKPSGLTITEYSMLANISRNPGGTVANLAKILVMDQTTATRNLQRLKKKGYVRLEASADDRRMKRVAIDALGADMLERARPLWLRAQEELAGKLGGLGFDLLLRSLQSVIG